MIEGEGISWDEGWEVGWVGNPGLDCGNDGVESAQDMNLNVWRGYGFMMCHGMGGSDGGNVGRKGGQWVGKDEGKTRG